MRIVKRCIGFVATLTFAAAGFTQDLTQTVTYKTVAVPINQALSQIAALTKVKLEAANDTLAEIVVIDVHDVVLDDLMKRIAAATSGQWKKTSDGMYILFRPSEIYKTEEAQEVSARVVAIRKAVAKLNEPLQKHPTLDAKTADDLVSAPQDNPLAGMTGAGGVAGAAKGVRSFLTGGTSQPAGRATARLLAQLDPTVLAEMEEGERIVFSTRPNRMQVALGRDSLDVLNTLVAEQGIWADAYQRKHADDPKNDVGAAVSTAIGGFMGVSNTAIQGTPVKALLCVQRQSMLEGYELRLKLYDAQGKEIFQGGQTMYLESSPLNRIDDLLKAQPASDGPEIELSTDSKAILTFLRGMTASVMGGAAAKDLSPEVLAKLRNPDKFDPLSFIHSEALIAAAASSNANLVADVPDAMLSVASFVMPGQKLTVKGFLKALSTGDTVNVESKDGWMVVKATRPVLQRSKRVDRGALAQLIKVAQAKGMVPLDDLAAYALKNNPLMSSEISQLYSVLFLPGAALGNVGMGGIVNWDMLRFYGTLSLAQRQTLGEGRTLALRTLLPAQTELVKRLTYYPSMMGSLLKVQQPGAQPAGPTLPAGFGGPSNEPTEVLPNGLPPNGFVSVKVKNDPVVKDAGSRQPFIQLFSTFGPQELGAFRALKDDPNMGGMIGSFLPDLAKFRLGNRISYDFTFQFTPEVTLDQQLQDSQIDPNSPALAFGDLPADFRKQVEDIQAAIKKSGGMPNIFGGGGPVKP